MTKTIPEARSLCLCKNPNDNVCGDCRNCGGFINHNTQKTIPVISGREFWLEPGKQRIWNKPFDSSYNRDEIHVAEVTGSVSFEDLMALVDVLCGCSDHGCILRDRGGMRTNGGCKCKANVSTAITTFREKYANLLKGGESA